SVSTARTNFAVTRHPRHVTSRARAQRRAPLMPSDSTRLNASASILSSLEKSNAEVLAAHHARSCNSGAGTVLAFEDSEQSGTSPRSTGSAHRLPGMIARVRREVGDTHEHIRHRIGVVVANVEMANAEQVLHRAQHVHRV